jgi:hypothetical protein
MAANGWGKFKINWKLGNWEIGNWKLMEIKRIATA